MVIFLDDYFAHVGGYSPEAIDTLRFTPLSKWHELLPGNKWDTSSFLIRVADHESLDSPFEINPGGLYEEKNTGTTPGIDLP